MRQKHEIKDVLVNDNFREVFNNGQDISHRVLEADPNIREIREGEIVFVFDGVDLYLKTKYNGSIKKVKLS